MQQSDIVHLPCDFPCHGGDLMWWTDSAYFLHEIPYGVRNLVQTDKVDLPCRISHAHPKTSVCVKFNEHC